MRHIVVSDSLAGFAARGLVILQLVAVASLSTSMGCDDAGTVAPDDAAPGQDSSAPEPSCDRIDCGGHGTCSIGPSGATCSCDAGYHAVGSTCIADETDLTLLEAAVSAMAPGSWYEIPDSRIGNVLFTADELAAIDPNIWAVSGSASAIIIWCSSAFDGRRWYFGVCGGHNAYNGNELYAFDLVTLTWSRLYAPSPLHEEPLVGGDYAAIWGPRAVHHYDGFVYSPRVNALFLLWPSPHSWRYRLDEPDPALAWEPFDSPIEALGDVGVWDQPYYKTAIHPDTGEIILYGGSNNATSVAALDPETLTYSRAGGRWDLVISGQSVGDIDPVRRRMYSINRFTAVGNESGVLSIDIDADPLPTGATTLGGDPPANVQPDGCFLHHPPSGLMWAWAGLRETATFDPDSSLWSSQPNAAGPAPTEGHPTGVYQKCIYVPELDVFAGYNNLSEGVWLHRMN